MKMPVMRRLFDYYPAAWPEELKDAEDAMYEAAKAWNNNKELPWLRDKWREASDNFLRIAAKHKHSIYLRGDDDDE
jgi:hypothetical protein